MLVNEIARVLVPGGFVIIRTDYRFDKTNIKRDPHYGLPLVILFPYILRKIVVCHLLKRSPKLHDYYWVKNYKEVSDLLESVGLNAQHFHDDIIAYKNKL